MTFFRLLVVLGVLATLDAFAATATNDPVRAEAEGREIVTQLLGARAEKNFTNTGTLRILNSKKEKAEIPVGFHTFVTPTNWQTLYFTSGPNQAAVASFVVAFTESRPNAYRISQGAGTNGFEGLPNDKAYVPFAGSDYWLADLALEFLHWPDQRVYTKDMKQGKLVWVLTSINPDARAGYSRVVSWINPESGGIFEAEAYDVSGKLLKRFEPKSVEKVNGQFQPRELVIKNVQTKSRTTIEFQFD
jgi:hypothetical protein